MLFRQDFDDLFVAGLRDLKEEIIRSVCEERGIADRDNDPPSLLPQDRFYQKNHPGSSEEIGVDDRFECADQILGRARLTEFSVINIVSGKEEEGGDTPEF